MRIGVDIDGVLYEWSKTSRYLLREVLPGSPYPKTGPLGQESTHWNYIQDNVSPEHWKWLWTEGVRLGMYRHGHLVHGAVQGVRDLVAAGHDIAIISHRPKFAVNDTLAWLTMHQLPLAGLHLLTNEEPKSYVKPMCDVYVDDKWDNVMDLARNTPAKLVALFDQPWNQELRSGAWDLKNIKRTKSWPAFVEAVKHVS